MNKKIITGLVVVVLVITGVIWQLKSKMSSTVTSTVEDVASDILKTNVTLSDLTIDMKQGKASTGRLTIASLEGYVQEFSLSVENIEADLDLSSMQDNVLIIESLRLIKPRIHYEVHDHGPLGSNVHDLLANVERSMTELASYNRDNGLNVIIGNLGVREGLIKASAIEAPGKYFRTELPDIRISGVSHLKGGVSVKEAVTLVSGELLQGIVRTAHDSRLNVMFRKNEVDWVELINKESKDKN